jgi:hypothetical protein
MTFITAAAAALTAAALAAVFPPAFLFMSRGKR